MVREQEAIRQPITHRFVFAGEIDKCHVFFHLVVTNNISQL